MTRALDILSKSVHVKQQASSTSLPTKSQSQLRPVLPQAYDGSRSCGKNFIPACQTYFQLQPDQFPDEQTKIQWAMTYMSQDCAQRWVTRIYDWKMLPKEFFLLHAEAVDTNTSAWKSGPVRFFCYFYEDRDWDRSLNVPGPQKTGLDRKKLVQTGLTWNQLLSPVHKLLQLIVMKMSHNLSNRVKIEWDMIKTM